MTMFEIREATPDDLPAICALGEAVNRLHHAAWPHVFAAPGDPMTHLAHWQSAIGSERAATFVGERQARVVGFVSVIIAQDPSSLVQPAPYARIGSVSVAEDQWGQGVGRALMQAAEAWARQRGMADLRLHVWDFNQRALRLYAELGYEVR